MRRTHSIGQPSEPPTSNYNSLPLIHTHVTQYTAHLTSAINRDSTVWQHTITNACQGHILPHPLHNPITIFNIHHNSYFITLITDNNTYSYCDSLNLQHPHTSHRIHNTLRQWYTNLPIAPQMLQNPSPIIITKSTPLETDGWSCGLHMLLINLATIYQGTLPTLRHTQIHAHHLSRIHLRYVLTGELDPSVPSIVRELHITDPRIPWPISPITYNTHELYQRRYTTRTRNQTHTTQHPHTIHA